jgi:DNA-binding NarL/FixJ family response regulator
LLQHLVTPAGVLSRLSARELEVLQLVSQGLTNRVIAEKLVISVNTVKKHVQSIFTKLNVNSRAAAVTKTIKRS